MMWRKHHLDDERRPSYPQGTLDWRPRYKVSQDGKKRQGRRKPISACLLPDSDDDEQHDQSPERVYFHQRSCPLYRSDTDKTDRHSANIEDNGLVPNTNLTVPASCLIREPSFSSNLSIIPCNCWLVESDKLKNNNNIEESGDNYDDKYKQGENGNHRNRRNKRRKNRNVRETVIINVGGQIFETYRSTLRRLRTPIFHSDDKLELYYRKSHKDYFFDRDPTAFGSILNYLRTGELHIPTNMCGPALQNELEFWGIDEVDISRCCWTQYNTWKTQCCSLEKLENDRKFSTTQEAYAWVSIIFVFVSIFSFCAETHPMFKVKAKDMTHFASFYEFFNVQSIPWAQVIAAARQNSTVHTNLTQHEQNSSSLNSSWTNRTTGRSDGIQKRSISKQYDVNYGCNICAALESHKRSKNNNIDPGEKELPHPVLLLMDVICLIFFTLEYLTRFVCSPSKLNFLRALQNVVDFLAFAPDYVEVLFLIIDPNQKEGVAIMEMLFILRILRLFRIFRLIRHVPGLWILLYTLKASFNELMLMCVFLLIGMVVFATLVHFVEPHGTFNNIPVGFWWSVVTMTTVGYGDMHPETAAGYIIGSCCAVAGLLMIAFTVPIIVSNFVLYYTHVQYGLARRDREIERMKDDVESDMPRSRSRLDAERIGSLTSLTLTRKSQQTASTTRNGKSYTHVSSRSDAENPEATSQASPEREIHDKVMVMELGEKVV